MAPRAVTTKVLLGHLQTLGFLANFKVGWTPRIQFWFFTVSAVSVANITNFSIDCVLLLPFYTQFAGVMLLPVVVLIGSAALLLLTLVTRRLCVGNIKLQRILPHFVTFNVYMMRMLHPIIAYNVLQLFDCLDFQVRDSLQCYN